MAQSSAMRMLSMVICIWLSVWAIRKRAEIDNPLDKTSMLFRWAVVLVGFTCAAVPGERFAVFRIVGGFTALAFLCWPDFAYRVTRQERRDKAASRFRELRVITPVTDSFEPAHSGIACCDD